MLTDGRIAGASGGQGKAPPSLASHPPKGFALRNPISAPALRTQRALDAGSAKGYDGFVRETAPVQGVHQVFQLVC